MWGLQKNKKLYAYEREGGSAFVLELPISYNKGEEDGEQKGLSG